MVNYVLLVVLAAMRRPLARLEDQRGQTLAEYAMIVTVVAVATVVIAVVGMRDLIATTIENAADCIRGNC